MLDSERRIHSLRAVTQESILCQCRDHIIGEVLTVHTNRIECAWRRQSGSRRDAVVTGKRLKI